MTPTPHKELQKNVGGENSGNKGTDKTLPYKTGISCCFAVQTQQHSYPAWHLRSEGQTSDLTPPSKELQWRAWNQSHNPEAQDFQELVSQAGQQLNGICYSTDTNVHCHCAHCNFGHPVTYPKDWSWDRTSASSSRACFESRTGETVIQYCRITGLNPSQVLNNGLKPKIYSAAKLFNSLNQVSCVCV